MWVCETGRLLTCVAFGDGSVIQVYDNNRTFTHDIKCFGPGMMLQAGHYKFDLYIISDSYIGLDVTQKVGRLGGHKKLILAIAAHSFSHSSLCGHTS